MSDPEKFVKKITDVPVLETGDKTMRDVFMVTDETVGSEEVTTGIVWVPPHTQNHTDTHHCEEIFYIIQGKGKILFDGTPVDVEAGNMVFMPKGVAHCVNNDTDDPIVLVWAIMDSLSNLGELADWHELEDAHGKDWSPWPFL